MILLVGSDIPSFKTLRFRRGLNVLLADVTQESTEGQTRNSAGKSSFVEIVHFLLGSDPNPGTLFKATGITGNSFHGVFRIGGVVVRVERRCADPKRIYVADRRARRLGLVATRDDDTGETYLPVEDWKTFLGKAWFGLPSVRVGTPYDVRRAPTFRMLLGYFARRSRDHGFAHVSRYAERQQDGDAQVALSYLLGLDWSIPREIRELKDRQNTLKDLRKAIKEGSLGEMFGTTAEIRPELARVEERAEQLRRRCESFQVHERFRELADEGAALRTELSRLTLAIASAKDTLTYLERTIADEKPPAYASVAILYEAVGIELPDLARRRFDDVERFQASVVANRKTYLGEQIIESAARLRGMEADLQAVAERRSSILRELQGKGAFEDLTSLQDEHGRVASRLETLREKLRNANILENKTAETKRESADLELRLQKDYDEHAADIAAATRLVDHAIRALYDDRVGNLLIAPTKNGPTFSVTIGGGGNQGGIDQMKVFCFDMMLYERSSERLGGPRFLIHDSHLFDGVDARQARSALVLGRQVAARVGGQYIVALNSDEFDKVDVGGQFKDSVLATRLTDNEDGGLFGFRFELGRQRG